MSAYSECSCYIVLRLKHTLVLSVLSAGFWNYCWNIRRWMWMSAVRLFAGLVPMLSHWDNFVFCILYQRNTFEEMYFVFCISTKNLNVFHKCIWNTFLQSISVIVFQILIKSILYNPGSRCLPATSLRCHKTPPHASVVLLLANEYRGFR